MADKKKDLDVVISQTLMSDSERFEYFFSKYWKHIAIYMVVAIVAIAVGYAIVAHHRSTIQKANFALADASTVEALEVALQKYANSPNTISARFRLVHMLVDEKKYDDAIRELGIIKDANPEEPLRGMALLDTAYIKELKGELEAAAEEFNAIGSLPDATPAVRAEACTNAGRIYLQLKQLDKAASALKRAGVPQQTSTVATAWSTDAQSLLIALESGEYGPYNKPETAITKQ